MSTGQSKKEAYFSSTAGAAAGSTASSTADIPVIDISALSTDDSAAIRRISTELGQAFAEIGFVAIAGHGIASSTIAELRQQVMRLFAQPMQLKQMLTVKQQNYRGYIPLGFFTPNAAGKDADLYEGYKLHTEIDSRDPICDLCDLYGLNKWPAEQPELKAAVLAYWHECDRVTQLLLSAIAVYLNLDPKFFREAFAKPLTNMTLLHYPPSGGGDFGIHPHKDTDVLTILAPDPVGGLFVRRKDSKQWIEATAPDDALIVNVGDMLEIWSAGRLVSTPHKVVNASGRERYSFPYFAVPRFDVEVRPLLNTDNYHRESMQVGNVSRKIWQSNWPDAAAVDECYDPSIPA